MKVRFDQMSRRSWEHHCDAARAPLQQRWSYGETVLRLGGHVSRLSLHDGSQTVALAQVLQRQFGLSVALINRGPVWVAAAEQTARIDAFNAFKTALRKRGVHLVLMTPESDDDERPGTAVMTPATVADLALTPDMRADLKGKWRNRLAKAEAEGIPLSLYRNRVADHDWLFANEFRQQRHRGYRNLPRQFTEAWLADTQAASLTITSKRRLQAGMIFLRHGTTATYHLGWSSAAARASSVHTLMLWHAMKTLRETGVQNLDLGLLDTVRTPGLARFKLGTGAKPRRLGPTCLSF